MHNSWMFILVLNFINGDMSFFHAIQSIVHFFNLLVYYKTKEFFVLMQMHFSSVIVSIFLIEHSLANFVLLPFSIQETSSIVPS